MMAAFGAQSSPSSMDRLAFIAEWFDATASQVRKFQLMFYPSDNSVELHDIKKKRSFLKRTKVDNVNIQQMFVGSKVTITSRHLEITDYADQFTRNTLQNQREKTVAVLSGGAMDKLGELLDEINNNGLMVSQMKMMHIDDGAAKRLEQGNESRITPGRAVALELVGENAVSSWKRLAGPADPVDSRIEHSDNLGRYFGTRNPCYISGSVDAAKKESSILFKGGESSPLNTATLQDCTCCIIKPHAVGEGLVGKILMDIRNAGFNVTALQMFHLDKANAEEFYEIYKGVVAEYMKMIEQLTSGPCVAMEVVKNGADTPTEFREFAGPADPEIARHLRPDTLRARYGRDKINNAIHCTDLPDDGVLEVEYFFKILKA